MPKSVRVLRATRPWLIEVRTQIDYFNAMALGIPTDQIELARRLALLVVPRFQNDERFGAPQIDATFDDVLRYDPKVSTVIFFGLTNQVLGYPDHLQDTADAFKRHVFNFGSIETYDAESGPERERHARAAHPGPNRARAGDRQDRTRQAQARRGRRALRSRRARAQRSRRLPAPVGRIKTATSRSRRPTSRWSSRSPTSCGPTVSGSGARRRSRSIAETIALLVGLAALAVPSIFVLLLDFFGWYRRRWAVAAYALTVLLYVAGLARASRRVRALRDRAGRCAALCDRGAARPDSGVERSARARARRHPAAAQPRLDARGDRRRAARRARRRRRHEFAAGDGRDRTLPRRAARARAAAA